MNYVLLSLSVGIFLVVKIHFL